MNWLQRLMACMPLVPGVVASVETMAGEAKSGADKKTLALQSLGLAENVAGQVDPAIAPELQSVTELVGGLIDATVGLFNKHGWPGTAAATPAAASTPPAAA
jgi:hypothetical protein